MEGFGDSNYITSGRVPYPVFTAGKQSPQEDTMRNMDGLKELVMAIIAAVIAFFSITSFYGFVASID